LAYLSLAFAVSSLTVCWTNTSLDLADIAEVFALITLLLLLIEKYEKLADNYDRFLEAYRTERSSLEKVSFRVTTTAIRAKASAAIQHLSALLPSEKTQQNPQPSIRSRSHVSGLSRYRRGICTYYTSTSNWWLRILMSFFRW
jgi:hypothetical protein